VSGFFAKLAASFRKGNFHARLKQKFKALRLEAWINTWPAITGSKIVACWWRGEDNRNWGDKINPVLIKFLAKKDVLHVDDVFNYRWVDVHSCIGSMFHDLPHKSVHVWGTGVISEDLPISRPLKAIHAVRGPRTRERLAKEGIAAPAVYGDPALLLPRFYNPDVTPTEELGIIPHYEDRQDSNVLRFREQGAFVIDIFGDELQFVDQVKRCKRVVSSSLHGLIVADAYGIASKWISLSDRVYGGGFKFQDYYLSIGLEGESPLCVDATTRLEELSAHCSRKTLDIDLDALLDSCPFYRP
jgi:pyruvyltransferase